MWIFLVLTFFVNNAHAGDVVDLYEKRKQDYIQIEEQNRSILGDLYRTQQSIKRINSDKNRLVQQKENVRSNIAKLNPVLVLAEQKISDQKIEIQKRLHYIVKFQDMSLFKIVFSSQSPSELDRNLRILRNLTDRDYTLLKTYFKNTAALKQKKEELLEKQASLTELEKQIVVAETRLNKVTANKNKMLVRIAKQKNNLIGRLRQIRQKKLEDVSSFDLNDQKREEFLSTLLEPLFFERKGSLQAPVEGYPIQSFGYFSHPVYKTKIRHKGVFLGTSTLAEIKSIAKGKVVHMEEARSSGHTIIVDHSDHYYSVYSYIESPMVKVGDDVHEGQVFATGVRQHPFFGEGLYFELRHFSEPVDPMKWIRTSTNTAMRSVK